MYAKTVDGIWFDVGHPFELHNAQMALIEKREELPFPMPDGEVLPDGSFISSTASVSGHISKSIILSGSSVNGAAGIQLLWPILELMSFDHQLLVKIQLLILGYQLRD